MSADTERLRELCASDDAAWVGDDGNECPACGTSMYLASPELERRGLCGGCSEELRSAVPGLLDALDALTAARNEACDIAEMLSSYVPKFPAEGGPTATDRRIAELRKVGK